MKYSSANRIKLLANNRVLSTSPIIRSPIISSPITAAIQRSRPLTFTAVALSWSFLTVLTGCTEESAAALESQALLAAPAATTENYSRSMPMAASPYKIGAGIADITGEAAESNMFGYADSE